MLGYELRTYTYYMWVFGPRFSLGMFSTEFYYTREKQKRLFFKKDRGGGSADFALLLNKLSLFNDCCLRNVKAVAFNVTRQYWRAVINILTLNS